MPQPDNVYIGTDYPLPRYAQPDSYGPAFMPLLVFLNTFALKMYVTERAQVNGILGGQATLLLLKYQTHYKLSADGGCGPETRQCMRERDSFDWEKAAMDAEALDGISAFVQLDGTVMYWAPYIGIRPDRDLMMMMFRKSRHGN